jgi:predicted RNA-binding Zn-ribbon protein involved in translation (DUF1610 family)
MNRGNPLGFGLVLVGAALLAVSTFLPLDEATGLFRFVQQNTLIQHDGWLVIIGALALAASGFRAYITRDDWLIPLVVSIFTAIGIIIWATNTDMRTLYPVGLDGTADSSKPGQVADWGISIYVAGLGVLLGFVGSLTLRQSGGEKKKCPECAETVLADAQVCKHCGHHFPDVPPEERRRLTCLHCETRMLIPSGAKFVGCPNCRNELKVPPRKPV